MPARSSQRVLLLLGVVALALIAALVLQFRSRARDAVGPEAALAAERERAALELEAARTIAARVRPEVEPPAAEAAPLAEAARPAATPARTPPPRDAVGTLRLTVLDAATDAPVPRARVSFIGLRREDDPASEYLWPGDPPVVETDVRGVAQLEFPAWVRDLAPTRKLDTTVAHVDYVAFRGDLKVESLQQDATVRLERGAFVIVSGWIGSPSNVVRDVRPLVDDNADLDAASWQPMKDGRPSTSRLAPGPHALAITWTDPQGATWHSRVEVFELAVGEQREMALELVRGATLAGRLDPAVPRPIEHGEVEVSVEFGAPYGATTLRTWKTDVAADGTFRLEGLPPGRGEVTALCDGWVSARAAEEQERGGETWTQLVNPGFALPAAEPVVVPMQRTAALVVRVSDAGGAPLEGARVDTWPNVVWRNGYSGLFMDRTWTALSDARGEARLENLPPDAAQGFAVRLEGWRRVGGEGPRPEQAEVELVSGETAEVAVTLERSGG